MVKSVNETELSMVLLSGVKVPCCPRALGNGHDYCCVGLLLCRSRLRVALLLARKAKGKAAAARFDNSAHWRFVARKLTRVGALSPQGGKSKPKGGKGGGKGGGKAKS
jgi:hypothetical protein